MDRDERDSQERQEQLTARRPRLHSMKGANVTPQEEELLMVLFDMVLEHCTDEKGRLNNWGRAPYTQALRLLAEAGFIHIDKDVGGHILATSLP